MATYAEAIDAAAEDTYLLIEALIDDGVGFDDFNELMKSGRSWNLAIKVPMEKKALAAHIALRMGLKTANVLMPIPEGNVD